MHQPSPSQKTQNVSSSNAHNEISYSHIWALTWPIMLSGLSTPLLGAVDTAILGHLEETTYLSAVAVGSSLLSIVFWLFAFLRMGATSLTARAFGSGETENIKRVLQASLLTAFGAAFLLMLFSPLYIPLGLHWMQPSLAVQNLAGEYCNIRILSAPAALANYAIAGWLIGQQRPKATLLLLFTINGCNIILDFWFIQGLGLNSRGAAWASVCAEYTGLLLGLYICFRQWFQLQLKTAQKNPITLKEGFRQLLQVNQFLFIRSAALLLAFTFFTAQGARLGDDIVAANAILLNLLLLVSFGLDGFAHAAEALTGSALGEKNLSRFYSACRRTFICAFWLSALYTLALLFFEKPLIQLYTNNDHMAQLLHQYWYWLVGLPFVGIWAFHLDGIYVGIGAAKVMAYIMLLSVLCIYLPTWWLTPQLHNHGLWLALYSLFISRGLLQGGHFLYRARLKKWQ